MSGAHRQDPAERLSTFGKGHHMMQRKRAVAFTAEKISKLAVAIARQCAPILSIVDRMAHL